MYPLAATPSIFGPEPDIPPPLLPTESPDDIVEISTQISEYSVTDNTSIEKEINL